MKKVKFTPGPWEVSKENGGSIFGDLDNDKHDGDHPYIGTVAGIGGKRDVRECIANARLIAAAPDLFNCLMDCVENILIDFPDDDIRKAKYLAAIAKATGK